MTQYKDFVGRDLKVGDFVTFPGGGNEKGEYGLILYRITKLNDTGTVRAERLRKDYRTKTIERKQSTLRKLQKLTKVDPPAKMKELFLKPDDHYELVANWLLGNEIDWNATN